MYEHPCTLQGARKILNIYKSMLIKISSVLKMYYNLWTLCNHLAKSCFYVKVRLALVPYKVWSNESTTSRNNLWILFLNITMFNEKKRRVVYSSFKCLFLFIWRKGSLIFVLFVVIYLVQPLWFSILIFHSSLGLGFIL